MRAVIYARISEDHERAESVPTQIANGTRSAERMGWEVVRVLKDEAIRLHRRAETRLRRDDQVPRRRAGGCAYRPVP
ncbi:MAG TPA: recombinase family protein [Propionibacteriaceae bacterium]|nr:recombinase family protein [Propionibacteriaceae bacterium]